MQPSQSLLRLYKYFRKTLKTWLLSASLIALQSSSHIYMECLYMCMFPCVRMNNDDDDDDDDEIY